MKINSASDIEKAKSNFSAMDQVDELEIGCEIWDVTFKIGENWLCGEMARWPNDRGAFSADGGQSDWGDWKSPPECCEYDEDCLLIDNEGDPDWIAKWVDDRGVEWVEVRIDEDYELPEGESYWWELEQLRPTLKAKFDARSRLMITVEEFDDMKQIKGWGDGPEHAPTPIKLV
jgi:hypothetical protein